jgi:hypothetical protein
MNEQLPDFVLAELFSKSLVITDDRIQHKSIQNNATEPQNLFLGSYEKKIIILVNDKNNLHLGDAELQFISRILAPCNLNLAHVAVINFHRHKVSFRQLKKEMQPQSVLMFGVTALQIELPFAMPDYQVQQYDNCSILTASALQVLNKNSEAVKTEKEKLWKSLRTMFNL